MEGPALLSEVTPPATGGPSDVAGEDHIDGLADRGPWTEHELSSINNEGAWSEGSEHSNIVPFAPVHGSDDPDDAVGSADEQDDEGGAEDDEVPGEEPINRGLLLKFLSSVRN